MAARSTISASLHSSALLSDLPSWQRQLWLWPHLFSLDAPCVAVLWQLLLMRDLDIHVSRGEPLILALCVWCVYIGDRVLDAMRPQTAEWEPARKTFYRKYLSAALLSGLCLFLAVIPLAYCLLRRPTFDAGLWLAVPLLFYLICVHLAPVKWRAYWPREMVIACVFTSGVFLALWVGDHRSYHRLWAPALLFSLLCWVNCCAIETWEWQRGATATEEAPSTSTQWGAKYLFFLALAIACSAVLMRQISLLSPGLSAAAFLSGAALAALALCRRSLSMNGFRVAADLALCTPLPILLLLHVSS